MGKTTRVLARTITSDPDNPDRTTVHEAETVDTPQDSMELSVNGKGEPSWSVKAYGADLEDIQVRIRALRSLAEQHAAEIRAGKGGPA